MPIAVPEETVGILPHIAGAEASVAAPFVPSLEPMAKFLIQKVHVSTLLLMAQSNFKTFHFIPILVHNLRCFIPLICFVDLSSSTRGFDALVLKDASYTFKTTLDLDVLKGITPGGDFQSVVLKDIEGEPSAPTS